MIEKIEYKPMWSQDGKTLSNVLLKETNLFGTYNVTDKWWDGSPMSDPKLDSEVYVKYEGKYLVQNFEYGQVLQKDTIDDMRALSAKEILLLRMGVYKHVQLNGYYTKDDTPAPINYILSATTATDDGGSVITAGSVKLEHEFKDILDLAYYGMVVESSPETNADIFNKVQNLPNDVSHFTLPFGEYSIGNIEIKKSGVYEFNGVKMTNDDNLTTPMITISPTITSCTINGLELEYKGIFYYSSIGYTGTYGVPKSGIYNNGQNVFLNNCKATRFSHTGFEASVTSKTFYLTNCIANNNGYSGCLSSGYDLQILGGQYNYNGGSNNGGDGYGNGYGIIGNVSRRGVFKVLGTNSIGNRSRNIDSHNGDDIIISNNYSSDAGVAHTQWFNIPYSASFGIRLTQIINRSIISNNIIKRCSGSGVCFDADDAQGYSVKHALITSNVFEDNKINVYIRPVLSDKILINNNQFINNTAGEYTDISILPIPYSNDIDYVKDLNISDNMFSNSVSISLTRSDSESKIIKSKILFKGNISDNLVSIIGYKRPFDIIMSDNILSDMSVSGAGTDQYICYTSNIIDRKGLTGNFTFTANPSIKCLAKSNTIKNSESSIILVLRSNTVVDGNMFISNNFSGSVTTAVLIQDTATYASFTNNEIEVIRPFSRACIRVASVSTTNNVYNNNVGNHRNQIDNLGVSRNINGGILKIDNCNKIYDMGFTTTPEIYSNMPFLKGSLCINSNPTITNFSDWIAVSTNTFIEKSKKAGLAANTATPAEDVYSKEQVQSILDELRDLKNKMIQVELMSNI